MHSIDPRINRLHLLDQEPNLLSKSRLDQLETYEVFQQKREDKPFTYVGPVHAPDLEMAFVFAKEQYSRRASCFGLWVVRTQDIQVTPYVGDDESVYQELNILDVDFNPNGSQSFEILILKKRGKAHTHVGAVLASTYQTALIQAKNQFQDHLPCINVWIIPTDKILKSTEDDAEMWVTTSEKKYREPVSYKVQDKITAFKNEKALKK